MSRIDSQPHRAEDILQGYVLVDVSLGPALAKPSYRDVLVAGVAELEAQTKLSLPKNEL